MASGESGRRQSVYKIFGEPVRINVCLLSRHFAAAMAARLCWLLIWTGTLAKSPLRLPHCSRHLALSTLHLVFLLPVSAVFVFSVFFVFILVFILRRDEEQDGEDEDGDGGVKPLLSNTASGNMECGGSRVYNKGESPFSPVHEGVYTYPRPTEEGRKTRRQEDCSKNTRNACKEGTSSLWTTKRMNSPPVVL
ncbi:uncharacterized protein ARB_00665 [Trichophyton benhamiae CBS 112371]|uniref:Uncharacterized protein n=1 Tax=Arthroderma benhamiae (strain ATCC MYA-4681 / CBS 112371) TaxID=663331 RepID=D4AWU9_ARTBC|nr:uncharacterized protein ARB_00665 [Trichophyton benhamiae CBS 112371]EFE32480.1 hypothetical protein ARB_00665 [Trichophyton benhamiae CBS 112371]